MSKEIFDILLLIARPAAGKSEIIDYLKKSEILERMCRFHIGAFHEYDDFPILWRWFEMDHILHEMGFPRRFSDDEGYFDQQHLWDLLIRLIYFDYQKTIRDTPDFHTNHSAVFEFSRGKQHGGYKNAFEHIDKNILPKIAILYVNVSWEESLRKNRKRFNPNKPDSILEHGLPDKKLIKLYRETDWEEIISGNPDYIPIGNYHIPYVVFENEDDITSSNAVELGNRLEACLHTLWNLYNNR